MGVWYIAYNLGLPKECYLLKISEGIHDEGAMKSGSSGFSGMNFVGEVQWWTIFSIRMQTWLNLYHYCHATDGPISSVKCDLKTSDIRWILFFLSSSFFLFSPPNLPAR